MVVVACAPSSVVFHKRNPFSHGGVITHSLPLSTRRLGLRLRVSAVLSSSSWSPPVTLREFNGIFVPSTDAEQRDAISLLNERIRREHSNRESPSLRQSMDSEEADKYIQLVKEQQQRGLQKLKGDRTSGTGDAFSYEADPYTLRPGDYVVHKKVGIGRFVGVKFDVPKGSSVPIEYVFIEYADVNQASRMLYRYNL